MNAAIKDIEKSPKHVAIIMDGNGRWAKQRNLPRTQGHVEGVKRVEEIIEAAYAMGIRYLTLYTFSTENWRRPQTEVSMLMNILTNILKEKLSKLHKNNIRFNFIGRTKEIPESVLNVIKDVVEETKGNTGLMINMAFNYGSRQEIIDGIVKIAQEVKKGKYAPEEINEQRISDALYTHGIPDPDLLIRTSGEKRISNFLLWQLSYAEFYFTDKFWPDFTVEELEKAVIDYQSRERRFGHVDAKGIS